MNIQAMKQALEALEAALGNINPERGFCDEVERDINKAIPALRAAITEAERQEPAFKTNGSILIALGDNTCFDAEWIDLYTTPQPAIPAGYALVPVEPTEEMMKAMQQANIYPPHNADGSVSVRTQNLHIYKAMLAAAPKPENSHD